MREAQKVMIQLQIRYKSIKIHRVDGADLEYCTTDRTFPSNLVFCLSHKCYI